MRVEFFDLTQTKVKNIYFSEERLIIETDLGVFEFRITSDCSCCISMFDSFIGAKNLLNNSLKLIKQVRQQGFEETIDPKNSKNPELADSFIEYTYQISCFDKNTNIKNALFSFRSYSLGWCGGDLTVSVLDNLPENLPPHITDDVFETISENN
jgi:hypothetical protein